MKMESLFPWAFRPSEEELTSCWSEAIVAFDASAMLNAYQFGGEARDQLFAAIEKLEGRLWFPHQAVEEFLSNREHVIVWQGEALAPFSQAFKPVRDLIKTYKRNVSIDHRRLSVDLGRLEKMVEKAQDEWNKVTGEARKHHVDVSDDPILQRLTEITVDRIGNPLSDAERGQRFEEARRRY